MGAEYLEAGTEAATLEQTDAGTEVEMVTAAAANGVESSLLSVVGRLLLLEMPI